MCPPCLPPAFRPEFLRRSYPSLRRCHKSSAVAMVRANQAERIMSDKATTQRRRLGKNGPAVLPIGLGCMSLSGTYGPSDDKAAEELIRRAVELGIDHFDSSDMYGWGHNEELLGRALKGLHDNIVIATKFGQTRQPGGACSPASCRISPTSPRATPAPATRVSPVRIFRKTARSSNASR